MVLCRGDRRNTKLEIVKRHGINMCMIWVTINVCCWKFVLHCPKIRLAMFKNFRTKFIAVWMIHHPTVQWFIGYEGEEWIFISLSCHVVISHLQNQYKFIFSGDLHFRIIRYMVLMLLCCARWLAALELLVVVTSNAMTLIPSFMEVGLDSFKSCRLLAHRWWYTNYMFLTK